MMLVLTHRFTAFFMATFGVLFFNGTCATAVTTSYHIGNSLTQDSQPLGIQAIAESRGLDHEVGFHIRASSSLHNIIANPNDVSVAPNGYGTFTTALPNNAWDIVTIQPHLDSVPLTTLGQDLDAITTIINLARQNSANAETNFYIYQGWPHVGGGLDYQNRWNMPSADTLNTKMSPSRAYYDHLIERVRDATDANVYMVPIGEVLYELDVQMKAREIPDLFTIGQLFRDGLHLGYGRGQFVAGVTTFSTILGQYPTELEMPAFYEGQALSDSQRTIILETIREVLDQHPYSGVRMPIPPRADFNSDLTVDEIDLGLWENSQGISSPYDPNRDGQVDGRDFLQWQRDYHPVLNAAETLKFDILDLNGDGNVTPADIAHWHDSFGLNDGGDVDGDGDTDGRDFLIWQRSASPGLADINGDFLVNELELTRWQETNGYVASTDANGDGAVDLADFHIWEEENGRTWNFPYALSAPPLPSQSSNSPGAMMVVPEPASASIVLFTVGVLALRIRKQ